MERRALATFAASIDSRQETVELAERAAYRRDRCFGALLTCGLTLFAVAVDGYHPYAEDGGLYVAGVKRVLNPAIYPYATEFVLEPMRLSLFAPAVAAMVRLSHLGLPLVLLLLHLASVWATLFAAWLLSTRCWAGRGARAGAVVLLACWLALPVAGTALLLMDPYVTARSFSTPCMVLALVGMLDFTAWDEPDSRRGRGLALWAGGLAIAGAMHPLMATYAAGATLMLGCARSPRRGIQVCGTVAMGAAALTLAGCLQAIATPESAEYTLVALTRTYWFLAEWRWYELAGLAAPLTILAALAWPRSTSQDRNTRYPVSKGATRALAQMAVATGATALLVAGLFAREAGTKHLVARMQPLRTFQIVYLVMALMLGAKLGERVLRRSIVAMGRNHGVAGWCDAGGRARNVPPLESPGASGSGAAKQLGTGVSVDSREHAERCSVCSGRRLHQRHRRRCTVLSRDRGTQRAAGLLQGRGRGIHRAGADRRMDNGAGGAAEAKRQAAERGMRLDPTRRGSLYWSLWESSGWCCRQTQRQGLPAHTRTARCASAGFAEPQRQGGRDDAVHWGHPKTMHPMLNNARVSCRQCLSLNLQNFPIPA